MFLLKLKMQDGFPRALVLFETSQLFNLTGAWTNTHSLSLSKTLLFKLTLNYLNQPAEAKPHFHQAMLRKTVPHAAHCFCWQWMGSWHFKYNFTNSYYCTEQLYYDHKMNLKQTSFKMKDSVQIFFRHTRTNAITTLKLENTANCF